MKLSSLPQYLKAVSELGYDQVFYNLAYKLGLHSGGYRLSSFFQLDHPLIPISIKNLPVAPAVLEIKNIIGSEGISDLIAEADEIVGGHFHRFGTDLAPIDFNSGKQTLHWVDIELGKTISSTQPEDVKLTWEPARFGWALTLGRAYTLTSNDKYAISFWHYFDEFNRLNPVNFGPNWSSAQEVAIRLLNILWAYTLLSGAPISQQRSGCLALFIEQHNRRIVQTLPYARSQNNNHYLSESVALISAGLVLPTHPSAKRWYQQGWKGFNWCLLTQIDSDGEYVQHSSNYHRLMLQLCLWIFAIDAKSFEPAVLDQLSKASLWLAYHMDSDSGAVPNLGANDGAMIFSLYCGSFHDFRAIVQAALNTFTNQTLPPGKWDEMLAWYGLPRKKENNSFQRGFPGHLLSKNSWCSIRTKAYINRPSHADHLHTELWWNGRNIAIDPGTYSYNLAPPWNNSLVSTKVHNTVTIDGMDQMTRVGKFLFANWGKSWILERTQDNTTAKTDAYRRLGIDHQRSIRKMEEHLWLIEDSLVPQRSGKVHQYCLRWLLADLDWKIDFDNGLTLFCQTENGEVRVAIHSSKPINHYSVVRAGNLLAGDLPTQPFEGWVSPTYLNKAPAYAITVAVDTDEACNFTSLFDLPVLS